MTIQSNYDQLLPFRHDLFPSFMSDQGRAAERIALAIERCAGPGLDSIADIGCGTGEILASVKRHWETRSGRPIRGIGVDCAEQEVRLASARHPDCKFVCGDAESMVHSGGEANSELLGVDWGRTAVIIVGHTLPHFRDVEGFLRDLARLEPSCLIVDLHEQWDPVVKELDAADAPPIRQPARGTGRPDGTHLEFVLTTKPDPEDRGRVLRGIEFWTNRRREPFRFWTSQLRRSSGWFVSRIQDFGYVVCEEFQYRSGYGPMKSIALSRSV